VAPPAQRQQAVLALQRTVGNGAVQRLLRGFGIEHSGGDDACKVGAAWAGHGAALGDATSGDRLTVRRRDADAPGAAAPPAAPPSAATLDEIERRYRAMIDDARDQGYDVAADNLEHWLQGSGSTRKIDVGWLRGFSAVTEAEQVNRQRFEKSLTKKAQSLKDGETVTFTDHWDRQLTASLREELYYASGTSTIKSTGTFTLRRQGKVVTIEGTVGHHWYDPYDWHAGLGAWIPGHGRVSDSDALLLEKDRGAKAFQMEADWRQTVTGSITIKDWWFDEESYRWTGP
jgi:hypothetical protein